MSRPGISSTIVKKMRDRRLSPGEIHAFLRMVARIDQVSSGYIPVGETSAPDNEFIYDTDALKGEIPDLHERGKRLLSRLAVIKLNGGRSTTMGGLAPKGTLIAKDGRSYLDIIAGQIQAMRMRWGTDIPLVLMDSFFTHEPTLKLAGDFPFTPITFVQHQVPRLCEADLAPLDTGTDDDWAPPGHGDIFESLQRSGFLDRLLSEGRRWAFISNLDNLAACFEPWILGLIARDEIDFLLEVTDRTRADRKGGTLIVRHGKLDLLEIAQVAPHDRDAFMDIQRFRVFNTNNLWIDLEVLANRIKGRSLELPLIQNRKIIQGTRVIQLETAMGAAIGVFPRARGLRVGRERFFPTKKVSDLFLLQSDACVLDVMDRLHSNPNRPKRLSLRPRVFFSEDFLEFPHRMEERFEDPTSVSLLLSENLEVSGDVFFEKNVRIEGNVAISVPNGTPYVVKRGAVLRDGAYP